MLREVVSSSSLRSIGYDRDAQALEVQFTNGSVYRYTGVPADVWAALRKSDSKGKFFQSYVRDVFAATRVT